MSDLEEQKKPPKKKPKTIRQQCAEDMADFKQQITETFTSKFDRLEQALTAIAAMQRDPGPPSQHAGNTPIQVEAIVHRSQSDDNPALEVNQTASNTPPVTLIEKTVPLPSRETSQGTLASKGIPLTSQTPNEAATLTHDNNNEPSPAWLIAQALGPQTTVPAPPKQFLPTSAAGIHYDEDMEEKVNQILTSTAHHLTMGPGKTGLFPHKYVSRGPDRKRPTFNMLSLSEHVWGIFMLIKERKVPIETKPLLYNHIQNIIEDTCSFDWATAVRPWSEEIFSQVDEGRLSWKDSATIQMLRMSMSRTTVAKIDPATGAVAKVTVLADQRNPPQTYDRSNYRQNQHHTQGQVDILKGGPPCEYFNSQQGCNQRSGHIIRGQKMIHVCRYCLYNTSASHQHSEVNCRNKGKFGPPHF